MLGLNTKYCISLVRQAITTTTTRAIASFTKLKDEVERFDDSLHVNAARTPPGSWYV